VWESPTIFVRTERWRRMEMEMGCREMGKRFEEASSHQGYGS
jgi:hypothetical protein